MSSKRQQRGGAPAAPVPVPDEEADRSLDVLLDEAARMVEDGETSSKKPRTGDAEELNLKIINSVGMLEQKAILKTADLPKGVPHVYLDVRSVKTQFHERAVVVELGESIVYLPRRCTSWTDKQIATLNDLREELVFVYEGLKDVKAGNPTSLVRFARRTEFGG